MHTIHTAVGPSDRPAEQWGNITASSSFFLLSAVLMLLGCFAISMQLGMSADSLTPKVILVGVLNIYELLLIALAAALITRRGQFRDGLFLLGIETVFLVDATYLNAEIFATDLAWGASLNGLLYALAIAKFAVIVRVLGIGRHRAFVGFWLVQMIVLFAMFGAVRDQASPDLLRFYTLWWIVGIFACATIAVAARLLRSPDAPAGIARPLMLILLAAPSLSMLGHLAAAHWIYRVEFYPALVAPLAVGLAAGLIVLEPRAPLGRLLLLQIGLPALAVLLSLKPPAALVVEPVDWTWLTVSPMRLTIVAAAGVYGLAWWLSGRWLWLIGPTVGVAALLIGRTPADIGEHLRWISLKIRSMLDAAIPRTGLGWGIVSIVGAFVFLALGAWLSWRKPKDFT